MERGAHIEGHYRYRLWRRWEEGPEVVFVLLNPSTADGAVDDPTLRRCIGFARRWGMGGLQVVNLFALRATDPRALREAGDPVGPLNDQVLHEVAGNAARVVYGWGNHGVLFGRGEAVWRSLGSGQCFGLTAVGQPRHPLYVRGDASLVPATPPKREGP